MDTEKTKTNSGLIQTPPSSPSAINPPPNPASLAIHVSTATPSLLTSPTPPPQPQEMTQRTQAGSEYRRGNAASNGHLSMASIIRIMRKVLPPDAKIAKEAKETIQTCLTEFIHFITHEANQHCQSDQRCIVSGNDVVWAINNAGFDMYTDILLRELRRYQESQFKGLGGRFIPAHNEAYVVPMVCNCGPFEGSTSSSGEQISVPVSEPLVQPETPFSLSGGTELEEDLAEIDSWFATSANGDISGGADDGAGDFGK